MYSWKEHKPFGTAKCCAATKLYSKTSRRTNTLNSLRQVTKMQRIKEDAFHLLLGKVLQSIQGQEPENYYAGSQRMGHVPIIEFVNTLLELAMEMRATDVHIEPNGGEVRIRFRVDGDLSETHGPLPFKVHAFLIARLKVMAHLDTIERRLPQDGRILYEPQAGGPPIDIRISTMPLLEGEKAVLRLLDTSHKLLDIGQLDFSAENEQIFRRLCHSPGGLILAAGPVNSGKTTALYAALQELNTINRNIVTIEDPVEYHLQGINQIQVNAKTGLSFAIGLRSILRQDPDIVMVGEIRDEETAEIAVRAALTGHLLLSTLHTGNAAGVLFRLLDMGIAPYLLTASLRGVLAQRLVRRICPECREAWTVSPELQHGNVFLRGFAGQTLYRGRGCAACGGTGYHGRLALQELLVVDDELRRAVLAGSEQSSIETMLRGKGRKSLWEDGREKVMKGLTTWEEVTRVIYGDFVEGCISANL